MGEDHACIRVYSHVPKSNQDRSFFARIERQVLPLLCEFGAAMSCLGYYVARVKKLKAGYGHPGELQC